MHRTGRKPLGIPVQPARGSKTRGRLSVILILFALAIVPYLNSLWGEFHFDDDGQITDEESGYDLTTLLQSHSPGRWLTFGTFFLNYRLHDIRFMPGWHAANILLHTGCVLALYWMLSLLHQSASEHKSVRGGSRGEPVLANGEKRGGRSPQPGLRSRTPSAAWPFLAAAVFAVHPLASEPVNYIQARAVILYTLFTLLAVCGTVVAHRGPTLPRKVAGAALAFTSIALAAFSKEVGAFFAAAAPMLYMLLFVAPTIRNRRRFWRIAAAALLALVAALLLWLSFSGAMPGIRRRMAADLGWHWWGQMIVFWRYLLRAAMPLPSLLSVDHYVPHRAYYLSDPQVLTAFTALVVLVLLPAIRLARSHPLVSMLLLLIPSGLAPYFLMTSWEMMVEYRFYLPLAGFCGLSALVFAYAAEGRRAPAAAVAVTLVVTLGALTVDRNRAWRTEVSLWEDAVQKAPRKARTVNGLAWALLKDKSAPDPKRALELAEKSFDPRFVDLPPGYNPYMVDTLAEALFVNGKRERAIQLEHDIIRRRYTDPLFFRQLARFENAPTPPTAMRSALDRPNGLLQHVQASSP